MYYYGLVGNCQTSGLISNQGSLDWLCLPRPDSPPVFGKLLDEEGGSFSVESLEPATGQQAYLENTTILYTTLKTQSGSEFRITDFCPRFQQHGRMYRPMSFFRIIEPISGTSTIKVKCQPVNGWEKTRVAPIRGNSHIRFEIRNESFRVITNMSLTHLCEETPFTLKEPIYFGLTWSSGIEEDLIPLTRDFLEKTTQYWKIWVKHCSIPTLYQEQTIRSALTLKLHCYEDTGAILAALTTSLPEEKGATRNWDYRFCWLRDTYYILSAFHNLGHFEEMEGFLNFLLNIAERHEHSKGHLRPVYRLDQTLPNDETEHLNWSGFCGSKPVRSNNQAAQHVQNDAYGEMILTLAPIFFDYRFHHLRTKEHVDLLTHLVGLCARNISVPDAGLWEIRDGWQEHSFSNLMCWAGIDRIYRIQQKGFLNNLDYNLPALREKAEKALQAAIWNGSLRNGPKDPSFDASLLQLPMLNFPDRALCHKTVEGIMENLKFDSKNEGFLFRYLRKDDFGKPQSAFLICSFWLVQALARIGKMEQANEIMKKVVLSSNELGLYPEHFVPDSKEQLGNFPQAYSHVGQINAAFSISPAWNEIL